MHYSVISIPSCISNPNYEWETIPRMIIVFDNKVAKEEVVLLRNLLKIFKGNCKWILTQKSFYHSNSYLLTVSGITYNKFRKFGANSASTECCFR